MQKHDSDFIEDSKIAFSILSMRLFSIINKMKEIGRGCHEL